jgi:hypothetical protein
VSATLASQASVAVGDANTGWAGHSIVVGPGTPEITGCVLSSTLMVWLAVRVLPQSSVAVHVRTYTAGQVPVGPLSTNVSDTLASQASVAVGVVKFGAAGHSIVVGPGKAPITGGWLSNTVIVCEQVTELSQASVAFQVRVMIRGQVPSSVWPMYSTSGFASQLSVAVAVPTEGIAVHSTVTLAGHVISAGPRRSRD